jgi:hypothetical protein
MSCGLFRLAGPPIPAGVFKPDAHGNATVVNLRLPQRVEAKVFAITLEPEAGSQLPTSTQLCGAQASKQSACLLTVKLLLNQVC